MDQPPTKRHICGACEGVGHDRRNWPSLRASNATNLAHTGQELEEGVEREAILQTQDLVMGEEVARQVPWDKVLYCLFDLETTGGSRSNDEIIEIAAVLLDPNGIGLEDCTFDSLVKPTKSINNVITNLTGTTNEMVAGAPPFN